jgi:hypothetical protein
MKLIFLGDSFTWGGNLDLEYALKNNIVPSDTSYIDPQKTIFKFYSNEVIYKQLNYHRRKLSWTRSLSKHLGYDFYNLALPGSSLQSMQCRLFEAEKNIDELKIYIICLPLTQVARMLVSMNSVPIKSILTINGFQDFSKINKNDEMSQQSYVYKLSDKLTSHFFMPGDRSEDKVFFEKYFNYEYFAYMFIQSLNSMINYLKNKNIKFVILPTWDKTIKMHMPIKKKYLSISIESKDMFEFFDMLIAKELEDSQLNFSFDINNIERLPCGHPSINAQEEIKNEFLKHEFFQKL